MNIDLTEQETMILIEILKEHERNMYDLCNKISHSRMQKVAQDEAEVCCDLWMRLEDKKKEIIQTSPFPPKV